METQLNDLKESVQIKMSVADDLQQLAPPQNALFLGHAVPDAYEIVHHIRAVAFHWEIVSVSLVGYAGSAQN